MLTRIGTKPTVEPFLVLEKTVKQQTFPPVKAIRTEIPPCTVSRRKKDAGEQPYTRQLITNLEEQRQRIDGMIEQAIQGKTFTAKEIVLLQAQVYRFSQNMEVVSHAVDRIVSSIKTILNVQV